jgi:hypothetical protein
LHEQLSQVTTEWSELAQLNFSNFQPNYPEEFKISVRLLDIDLGKDNKSCWNVDIGLQPQRTFLLLP